MKEVKEGLFSLIIARNADERFCCFGTQKLQGTIEKSGGRWLPKEKLLLDERVMCDKDIADMYCTWYS